MPPLPASPQPTPPLLTHSLSSAPAASMDERTAEVVRVVRVLAAHVAEHAKSTAFEAQDRPVDAYEVLDVGPDTPAGGGSRGLHLMVVDVADTPASGCGFLVDGCGWGGGWGAGWRLERASDEPADHAGVSTTSLHACAHPAPRPSPPAPAPLLSGEGEERYWRLSLLIHVTLTRPSFIPPTPTPPTSFRRGQEAVLAPVSAHPSRQVRPPACPRRLPGSHLCCQGAAGGRPGGC